MPILLWVIIIFAGLNALWAGFALSGVWLMDPSDTVGQISDARETGVMSRLAMAATLYAGLAYFTWRRSRIAVFICFALIGLKVIAWVQTAQIADALPEMPAAMIGIWAFYRVLIMVTLFAAAAYLWRLFHKDRLG